MASLRNFYSVVRDLHLYVGLFLSPIVLVFCVSTIMLNHRWEVDPVVSKEQRAVRLENGLQDREQGRRLMKQLSLSGELRVARRMAQGRKFLLTVAAPGSETRVDVNVPEARAEITHNRRGVMGAAVFMHMMPGPHKPRRLLEWTVLKLWGGMADFTVYALLFLSITGIYLWATIKAERKAGLIVTGAGIVTLLLIMIGFYRA